VAGRRIWMALGAAAAVIGVVASSASAVDRATAPAASALVVAAADVPGSIVSYQGAVKATGVLESAYERQLLMMPSYGASKYRSYTNDAFVFTAKTYATLTYGVVVKQYSSAKGRQSLLAEYFGVLKSKGGVKVTSAEPRRIALGEQGVDITMAVNTVGYHGDVSVVIFQLDRVLEVAVAIGDAPAVHPANDLALGTRIATRVKNALTTVSTVAPSIAGTAQQAQTLVAAPGTWTNAPTAYADQWQHCDATGANCTDIAGATGTTYVVTPADVGTTIRVSVTATNGIGSVTAASPVTAVVT
jgi:hypothetical protein